MMIELCSSDCNQRAFPCSKPFVRILLPIEKESNFPSRGHFENATPFFQLCSLSFRPLFEQSLFTPLVVRKRAFQAEGRRFYVCRGPSMFVCKTLTCQMILLIFFVIATFFPIYFSSAGPFSRFSISKQAFFKSEGSRLWVFRQYFSKTSVFRGRPFGRFSPL